MRLLAVLLLALGLMSGAARATPQIDDRLVVDRDTAPLHFADDSPLEIYLEGKSARTFGGVRLEDHCTALWRGYVATWLLEGDSLFLVRVQVDYCSDNPPDLDLVKEFGTGKVYAWWVNGRISAGTGKLLQYSYNDVGVSPFFEGRISFTATNGKASAIVREQYLQREREALFPGEQHLKDTLSRLILKTFTDAERRRIADSSSAAVNISFSLATGKLDTVTLFRDAPPSSALDSMLLKKARQVALALPRLMKVHSQDYHAPGVRLYFRSHCLKYPEFAGEAGCGN